MHIKLNQTNKYEKTQIKFFISLVIMAMDIAFFVHEIFRELLLRISVILN